MGGEQPQGFGDERVRILEAGELLHRGDVRRRGGVYLVREPSMHSWMLSEHCQRPAQSHRRGLVTGEVDR